MVGLPLSVGAALSCLVACFALMPLARKLSLVDVPTGRKQHISDVPLIGGISIFLVFGLALAWQGMPEPSLMLAMALLTALGVFDDKIDMPAIWKLSGQVLAALIACLGSGVIVTSLGTLPSGNELLLGPFALPMTVIALVGLINAMNMIDGIDGLAAGLALLALAHLAMAMSLIGKPLDSAAMTEITVFAGAIFGFLALNLGLVPGRKVFLGDAGSMLLGLFIGVQLIEASQRQPLADTLPTSLVPWMVALPVIDTLRLIFSRLKQGRSPLSPDRTHLHHILLDTGLSPRLTLIAMLFIADTLFWGGFALSGWDSLLSGLIFVLIILVYVAVSNRYTKSSA